MTELTLSIKAFAGAFAAVSPILNAAVKIPAYQHLRVELENGRLTLSASDLDSEARAVIDAKGEDCAFLMPRPVADFLAGRDGIAPADARLTVSDGAREIVAVHGRARIVQPGLPADDFVPFNADRASLRFTLRAGELSGMLKACAKAIAESDPARAFLEGAFIHPLDGELRAVGGDGNRMHVATIDAPDFDGEWPTGSNLPGIIVPKRAVDRIIALIDGLENEVAITASPGFLSIRVADLTLFTKLIAANWPDYTRLVPARGETSIDVDGAALARAIKALAVVPAAAKGKAGSSFVRAVRIELLEDGVGLTMKGDLGVAEDFVAADVAGRDTMPAVAFGGRYVEDAIAAMGGGRVRIVASPGDLPNRQWLLEGVGRDGVFAIIAPRVW